MALTLTEIQALTDDVWLPSVQDNWSKGNVAMHLGLEKAEKIGPCEFVRAPFAHAKSRGGAMGAATIFDTAKKEVVNAARFPWSFFWSGITMDIEDEVMVSGGDAEIDLLMTKLDNAQKTIRDNMGDSFWASFATSRTAYGAETKPFYGVPDLMLQTGSTKYGDVAYDDIATWKAYENSGALTMNFATMQTLRRGAAVSNDAGGKPDIYITTETLKDALENALNTAHKQIFDDKLAQAGFDNIKIGSRGTVLADDKCPSGHVNAFNFDRLFLKVHRDLFFAGPVWKMPTDQALKTAQILIACVLGTNERRAHGRLTTVS